MNVNMNEIRAANRAGNRERITRHAVVMTFGPVDCRVCWESVENGQRAAERTSDAAICHLDCALAEIDAAAGVTVNGHTVKIASRQGTYRAECDMCGMVGRGFALDTAIDECMAHLDAQAVVGARASERAAFDARMDAQAQALADLNAQAARG